MYQYEELFTFFAIVIGAYIAFDVAATLIMASLSGMYETRTGNTVCIWAFLKIKKALGYELTEDDKVV